MNVIIGVSWRLLVLTKAEKTADLSGSYSAAIDTFSENDRAW
jgi:hypothetical protein